MKLKNTESDIIILNFDLLNPNDEMLIELLCTGKVAIPTISARIEGMREIGILDVEMVRVRQEFLEWARYKGVSLLGLVVFLSIIIIFVNEKSPLWLGIAWLLFTGLGLIIVLAYWLQYLNASRRSRRSRR